MRPQDHSLISQDSDFLSSRWGSILLALIAGATAALALPPLSWLPLLVPAFSALALLMDRVHKASGAFALAFSFSFGFHLAGLWWISEAFAVRSPELAWLGPPSVLGMVIVLAMLGGLVGPLTLLNTRPGAARHLRLAASWAAIDWVRSLGHLGFPWNPIGSVWDSWLPIAQFASVVGVDGLGLITVMIAAVPTIVISEGLKRDSIIAVMFAVLTLIMLWIWGEARIPDQPSPLREGITLRLVQAAIPQHLKWRSELKDHHIATYIALSRRPSMRPITHLIWPETAIPVFLEGDLQLLSQLAREVIPEQDGLLITGVPRRVWDEDKQARLYNSMIVLDGLGALKAVYDKERLVPFGEYIPLSRWLPFKGLAATISDFTPGKGRMTLRIQGLPSFSPLICYEVIFPGDVIAEGDRPDWLLNLSNDAWFGDTPGPYQHLAAARFRAIEEGLPLIRSTNTGITAIFDGYGRVLKKLNIGKREILDVQLPHKVDPRTVYSSNKSITLFFMIFLCISLSSAFHFNSSSVLKKAARYNR